MKFLSRLQLRLRYILAVLGVLALPAVYFLSAFDGTPSSSPDVRARPVKAAGVEVQEASTPHEMPKPRETPPSASSPALAAALETPSEREPQRQVAPAEAVDQLRATAAGLEARLDLPPSVTYWTATPLHDETLMLPVETLPPAALPPNAEWAPLARVHFQSGAGRGWRLTGRNGAVRQILQLPVAKVAEAAARRGESAGTISLTLAAGSRVSAGGRTLESFSPPSSSVILRSLADTEDRPARVLLDLSSSPKGGESPVWMRAASSLRQTAASLTVELVTAKDLLRLAPLLAAAAGFNIDTGNHAESAMSSGIHLVRAGKIVASLNGPRLSWQLAQQLATLLGADFGYRGRTAAYLGGPGRTEWPAAGDIFVYNAAGGDRLYAVNAALLEQYPIAARFVNDHSRALFSGPVELPSDTGAVAH